MDFTGVGELSQLQKNILGQPLDITHWRLLYTKLSSQKDNRAVALGKTISQLSKILIERPTRENKINMYHDNTKIETPNHISEEIVNPSKNGSEDKETLERAHSLADSGRFEDAKRILVKLQSSDAIHIKYWAKYLLAKCLYDQYQLISASKICQDILKLRECPRDLLHNTAELNLAIEDGVSYQSEICSNHIKPSFYHRQLLRKRPHTIDLPTTSSECYQHYQNLGHRLGLNPAPWFNTQKYLTNNPDISKSGCCPFFHYLAAGKKEGRIATDHGMRFASQVNNQASLPKDLYEDARSWLKPLTQENHLTEEDLQEATQNSYILAISHDCYYESPGGIQLCIQKEQRCFQDINKNYIHAYARQPSPMPLHSENPQTELVLSINGEKLGTTSLYNLFQKASEQKPELIVLHSLLGIAPANIMSFINKGYDSKRILYWMHDYSALCSSYQLLRNKVKFCAAPSPKSAQCKYCFYGNSREGNVTSILPLLKHKKTELLFPSNAALATWEKGASALGEEFPNKKHIINHISLNSSESVNRVYKERLPRIAFLGHPAFAKGWDTFSTLVRDFELFNKFDWYHLGATSDSLSADLEHVDVNIAKSTDAMITAVREMEIDFALVWPQWPETFCITAYEAVIGGANIITNEDSGNVAAFARSIPYGHVVANSYMQLKVFLLELTPEKTSSLSFPSNVEYEYSKMSAEVFQ
jgi:hypothetical protein